MVGGSECSDDMGLKKGPWTPEEDQMLIAYVQQHGHGSWRSLPSKAWLRRCGKSCRLRWTNYLRPDINRGKFSLQEEQTIFQLHALLGNRWSSIATHLPKRTDNQIKNYWNTHLKKRLNKMGIDPITHKPKDLALNTSHSKEIANISHLAQWESARLQAESRLVSSPYSLLNTVRTGPLPPPLSRPPCLDILKVWEWTNPGKDISSMILNGFSPSNGSQNQGWGHMLATCSGAAPTENMLPNTIVGLADENSGAPSVAKPNNPHQGEVEGIMDKSVEMDHDTTVDSTFVDDSLGFPSFINDFTDLQASLVSVTGTSNNSLGGCLGVLEENKIWPMGSPIL